MKDDHMDKLCWQHARKMCVKICETVDPELFTTFYQLFNTSLPDQINVFQVVERAAERDMSLGNFHQIMGQSYIPLSLSGKAELVTYFVRIALLAANGIEDKRWWNKQKSANLGDGCAKSLLIKLLTRPHIYEPN